MDPSQKRLAIHVEDHPLEYASFEGTIPKGNYGAGEVEIWDSGSYSVPGKTKKEQEDLLRKQLEKGELKFTLNGNKLKGDFALVKIGKDPQENQWLLIKKKDSHSAEERNHPIEHNFQEELDILPITSMPHHVEPMLAYSLEEPFDNPDWIFENKWDGYRAIAEVSVKKTSIYSRHLISFNDKFPTIVSGLQQINEEMILDGEIVILDKEGHSQFQLLQNYLNTKENEGILKYCVFDLLFYKGHDLRELPLIQRKEILHHIVKKNEPSILFFSKHIQGEGKAFFRFAKEHDLEGMIAKEAHSTYVSKRSREWLKIKTHQRQEVVIGGFTPPQGSRKKFGALIVGVYHNKDLKFVGGVGGGFTEKSLKEVYEKLSQLVVKECPFKDFPKTHSPITWVEPKLICEVKFQHFTKEGIMRQPIFQGLRIDKRPKEVVKEKVLEKQPKLISQTPIKTNKDPVIDEIISNPKKVLWPEQGYTKENLLEYYQQVAPFMLPHLKKRPITMYRFPEGIQQEGFFHKDAPDFLPKWIETVFVERMEKNITYILISNLKSLLYVVNLGSIEIHPFLSQIPHIDFPDQLVLDIDPVDLPFDTALEVAEDIHQILEKLDIKCHCKTSGKRGLHIYLTLEPKYHYDSVEQLAKLLAYYIHEQIPEITSLIRDPKKRQKKVYIDYLQNGPGKTVVAPYSVRAVEGATVSTPLDWKEVKKGVDPHDFNIKSVPQRLTKKSDLFKPTKAINIQKLLKKIAKESTQK